MCWCCGRYGATVKQLPPVDVPDEFTAIGYSGQFHLEVPIDRAVLEHAIHGMPATIPGGWLVLRADLQAETAVLVREDAAAMEDLYHKRDWTVPLNLLKIRPWE